MSAKALIRNIICIRNGEIWFYFQDFPLNGVKYPSKSNFAFTFSISWRRSVNRKLERISITSR